MLAWRPDIRREMLWIAMISLARPEGFEPPTHCLEGTCAVLTLDDR
jgi:hypothetical protein